MAIRRYLAMTEWEIEENQSIAAGTAWMNCCFSPEDTGLSGLPRVLPEGSILMLNDSIPLSGHDFDRIAGQLAGTLQRHRCRGLVLDFQRPGEEETWKLIAFLLNALPCPTAVSDLYADRFSCPVFLSPVPPSAALESHCAPWAGRDIWLDISTLGQRIRLTEEGAVYSALPGSSISEPAHRDSRLHCHYAVSLSEQAAEFTLWRTEADVETLTREAESRGISTVFFLYQELKALGFEEALADR